MINGQRLNKLRRDQGLTLVDLEKLTGIARQQLMRYENESVDVTSRILIKLVEVLGTSADYLLGMNVETYPKDYSPKILLESLIQIDPILAAELISRGAYSVKHETSIDVSALLMKLPPEYVAEFLLKLCDLDLIDIEAKWGNKPGQQAYFSHGSWIVTPNAERK